MSDVFISYARSTAREAQRVAQALRALGYSVWIDDDLPAHRTYGRVIEEEMNDAKAAVVIWSVDAVQSEWVLSEANRAREDRKLVQVTTDKTRLPMPFDTIQCADMIGWEGDDQHPGWRKAVASVAALVGAPIVGAAPAAAPAAPAREAYTNNLPRRPSALIGRGAELADLAALLAKADLVTITGTGGVGKTRIAIEVGALQIGDHEDGVWLAELAPVSNSEQVPGAVARAMNIDLPAAQDALTALVDRLRPRHCLILLDNCEHVIDAVAALAERVLDTAPGVKMLASSQELLGVEGEQVYRLRSLGEPDAVALFTERAQAADVGFRMTPEGAAAAAAICQRLDGIPLAIEMAAARAPSLGCEGVLQRLDDRFRVLTGGRRTALPRQRTLLATLDWSHGLLSPRDAAVFRRLGIFTGGFSLEAASDVAASEGLDAYDVVDALSSLVAKSLVVADPGDGRPRYRLLETTRAYALEKLDATGETLAVQRRHAEYFLRLTAPLASDYRGAVNDDVIAARYYADLDNIDRAIDWSFGPSGDPQLGIALLAAASWIWLARGLFTEQLRWLEIASPHLGPHTPEPVRTEFLVTRASAFMMTNQGKAMEFVDEAVDAARALGDPGVLIEALNAKGFSLVVTGRAPEARPVAEESVARVASLSPSRLAGQSRHLLANIVWLTDGEIAARPLFAELVEELRSIGAYGMANFFYATSTLAYDESNPGPAITSLRELLATMRPTEMFTGLTIEAAATRLMGNLSFRGEPGDLEEAVEVARTYQKAAGRGAFLYIYFGILSRILVLAGRSRDAAKLLAYADVQRAARGARTSVTVESSQKTWALISAELPEAEVATLRAEGAKLTIDEALSLATAPV